MPPLACLLRSPVTFSLLTFLGLTALSKVSPVEADAFLCTS